METKTAIQPGDEDILAIEAEYGSANNDAARAEQYRLAQARKLSRLEAEAEIPLAENAGSIGPDTNWTREKIGLEYDNDAPRQGVFTRPAFRQSRLANRRRPSSLSRLDRTRNVGHCRAAIWMRERIASPENVTKPADHCLI